MTVLFIVAHAPLASALQAAALHTFAELAGYVAAFDVPAGADTECYLAEAERRIQQLVAGEPAGNGCLILTDAAGATPANLACSLARQPGRRALAGVNLPMLLRALNYRHLPLDQLAHFAREGALGGVQSLSTPSPQHQTLQVSHHDPQHSHHQQ